MRYFVTGATGFIGGHVARQLLGAGHDVVALVRDPKRAQDLAGAGAELAKGDVLHRASMRDPVDGVDGVFHLAAWYEVGTANAERGMKVNVQGTRNVLELVADAGVPKAVYTSSLAVNSDTHGRLADESYRFNGPFLSRYDEAKWRAHHEVALPLMADGVPIVTVMPGVVYGPGDASPMAGFWRAFLARKLPAVPRVTAYCWTHVEDCAHGHVLAMEKGKPGETYMLPGPAHALTEAVAIAEDATGVRGPPQWPPAVFKALAAGASLVERFRPLPPMYASESQRVVAGVTYLGDGTRAREQLGFEPRALRDGLPEALAALRSR